MIEFERIAGLHQQLLKYREVKLRIGFVPTMGALHIGHKSLIDRAKLENDRVVCSIFVNPTQFNDPVDLARYPRTPDADRALLSGTGCDVLFMPQVSEIYPDDTLIDLEFGWMEQTMEGRFRPGHFRGMATVVSRFLSLVEPDSAYFGEKDFQQLAIIRELSKKRHPGISIIGCETIRESDGLAFSSRNVLLTPEERGQAGVIYKTLVALRTDVKVMPADKAVADAKTAIESVSGFQVQYLELVESETLRPITGYDVSRPQRACVAVITSRTRLIDNLSL